MRNFLGAWVVAVNMGYGHQRTAFPLRDMAPEGKIINANDYQGIPLSDRRIWEWSRRFYEFISNFSRVPLIGGKIFSFYNYFQEIFRFYPKKDLSRPNLAVRQISSLIKRGFGKDLIDKLRAEREKLKAEVPIISTFYASAFMAEFFDYPDEIFCVICDADISRAWASLNPKESRIKYFAPTERVMERLKLYGVKTENIFLTGYPLPQENTDSSRDDLKIRLLNLDPEKRYREKYQALIQEKLGILPEKSSRPLTIMFSVGGAGAQKEIGVKLTRNLKEKIKNRELRIILSIGVKEKIRNYFEREIGRERFPDNSVEIISSKNINDYFEKFNQALKRTDILWTKPSELSFYAALGIPIIISPPIGSQEEFNMRWLLKSGFGMQQENPNYVKEWLFDWLKKGYLAEAAMEGFIEGERSGTANIKKIVCGF